MLLNTTHFGDIEVDEKGILTFQEGLPGFENIKKYVLHFSEEADSPFRWLQSIDSPELAFAIIDPFYARKDYDFKINDETIEHLEIKEISDVSVYSIVVVPEDMAKISMNLKAPIIINNKSKKGAQVILDTDKYGVRHYILEELRKQEVYSNACSDKEEGAVYNNK